MSKNIALETNNLKGIHIPEEIIAQPISWNARFLWGFIFSYQDDSGISSHYDEKVGELCHMSERTLFKIFKELKDNQLLEITHNYGRGCKRKALLPQGE